MRLTLTLSALRHALSGALRGLLCRSGAQSSFASGRSALLDSKDEGERKPAKTLEVRR